jgi:hypothetical protein
MCTPSGIAGYSAPAVSKNAVFAATTFVVAITCVSFPVNAEDAPSPAAPRHGLFANVGAFSAIGYGGITYVHAPFRHLDVEAGAGLGVSGLQISLMPKFVLGDSHRLLLSAGPSVGYFNPDRMSLWVNADVGYEFRSLAGFSVGLMVGWTQGLAGCMKQACRPGGAAMGDENPRQSFSSEKAVDNGGPQGRLRVGYWF